MTKGQWVGMFLRDRYSPIRFVQKASCHSPGQRLDQILIDEWDRFGQGNVL